MKIVSIEPTPSPNTMKVQLNERLSDGIRTTYSPEQASSAKTPLFIQKLLHIEGVKSIYHAADFIAVDRTAKADWQYILAQVREVLGGDAAGMEAALSGGAVDSDSDAAFGEVQVLLQHFRGIPLQVRVQSGAEQQRTALPERFSQAAVQAAAASPNLIKERSLEDWGIRYGELKEVLEEVAQEIDATYDEARLQQLIEQAQQQLSGDSIEGAAAVRSAGRATLRPEELLRQLADPDWKQRYAALQQVKPSAETLPLLIQALDDEKSSIRRLATVYLGDLKEPQVLPYLYRALEDSSASVRRTAGDTLSDIGDPAAAPAMIQALKDPNKLVRWRAARFLYEVGDDQALAALHEVENDAEFEIRMQIKMAIERIEGGHAAEGSVWQQMTRRSQ
ncbi:conserved virulence factor C family protein [Paenibacillus radicis (ex Xue et al. 2023)]|uniref:Conserved virulence factor C family protein n=1 Tax=Paenibacillus radicis (ex Xue et al. 2023) TaxID=2972489 RepID=A0ABT1YLG1_9BACL|nr:conserved virulence factor C family protein [Paenibacillus radicis (ex Xue et al. 2023)]MCR8633852.1 conserved virulence factor C family protein [Paenibacillus radicis (ex Xue et al. 2023)]